MEDHRCTVSATCQASPFRGLSEERQLSEAPKSGFRGWQVNPNSIFGEDGIRLRPHMEVWFCALAGTDAARHTRAHWSGRKEGRTLPGWLRRLGEKRNLL